MSRGLKITLAVVGTVIAVCCVIGIIGSFLWTGDEVSGPAEPTAGPTVSANLSTAQTPSPSPTSTCLSASKEFLNTLGITGKAWAVAQTVTEQSNGLFRKGTVWYVSTKDGATWVSSTDPTSSNDDGLILPLNAKARSASDQGVDVVPSAPAYQGVTNDDAGAAAARACAGA